MSRLTARKRWLMTGPWPHPKTGIFYYRKATPADLWDARDSLAALGVKVTREVQRSLGTKDRAPAEERYHEVAGTQSAVWATWRELLKNGPQPLTHKQIAGLAADHARSFLAKHEEEPSEAPPAPLPPIPDLDAALAMMDAAKARLTLDEWSALVENLIAFEKAEGVEQLALAAHLLEQHPEAVGGDLAAGIEKMFGADTDAALAAHRLHVDDGTRRGVNLAMADFMRAAREGLEVRQQHDWGPVEKLERAPTFTLNARPSASASNPPKTDAWPSLIYLLHHKAAANGVRPKTVKGDEGYLKKFIRHVGHDDATKVTKADVRGWRDGLIAQTKPALSSKTINNKYLSALKAVLHWGVDEFDLPFNAADGIRDGRTPKPSGRKEWSPDEATMILKATFKGSSKSISEPHRRAVFWAPWIAAYTGLRITEITQL
jgi:hypothetical protein